MSKKRNLQAARRHAAERRAKRSKKRLDDVWDIMARNWMLQAQADALDTSLAKPHNRHTS